MADRIYMTPATVKLLRIIREREAGKAGYNADYRQDDRWTLTNKTFDQVRNLGRSQVLQGEPSSAIGGYQFITKTLDGLRRDLGLTGKEIFNEAFQDDLAYHLMVGRGLNSFLRGEITAGTFCNNLAKEWASLPVVTATTGATRRVLPGQSYYAGDGLNRAFHKPETILAAVKALRAPVTDISDPPFSMPPDVEPPPVGTPVDDDGRPIPLQEGVRWGRVAIVAAVLGAAAYAAGRFIFGWW